MISLAEEIGCVFNERSDEWDERYVLIERIAEFWCARSV